MTFTITAWGPDGRSIIKRRGPLLKEYLVDENDETRNGEIWTAAEDAKLRRLVQKGKPDAEIAASLGRGIGGIRRRLAILKLTNTGRSKFEKQNFPANPTSPPAGTGAGGNSKDTPAPLGGQDA